MSRDIKNNITVATDFAQPGNEICDVTNADRQSGLQRIAKTINHLYDRRRHAIINDAVPTFNNDGEVPTDGGKFNTDTDNPLRYRCKSIGTDDIGNAEIACRIRAYYRSDGGNSTFRVSVTSSLDENAYQDSGYGIETGWYTLTGSGGSKDLLTVPDDSEFFDLTFNFDIDSKNISATNVHSINCYYNPDNNTELPIVDGGSDSYPSGFIPMDIAMFAGNKPASVHRMKSMHSSMIALYKERTSQFVNFSTTGSVEQESAIIARKPENPGVDHAVFYFYGQGNGTIAITSLFGGETAVNTPVTLTADSWTDRIEVPCSSNTINVFLIRDVSSEAGGAPWSSVAGWYDSGSYNGEF